MKERERNINVWLTLMHLIEDLAHNPGMCPDWESNQRPFGSQTLTQSPEPQQPGLFFKFFIVKNFIDIKRVIIMSSHVPSSQL